MRGMVLGIGAAIVVSAMVACGGDDGEPRDVTLGEIVADQASFDGDTLRLRGEVVGFENPEHYVIEDANHNRVELLPRERAAEYEGETVVVVGEFAFSETEGRRLQIEEIEVAD
jgi:hypothetical protein